MDETYLIDELSDALGRRIRKPASKRIFQILIGVFNELSVVGFDELAKAETAENWEEDYLYDTDEKGNVWAILLPEVEPGLFHSIGNSFQSLQLCVLRDTKLDPEGARVLGSLPALKYLLVNVGEQSTEILNLLSQSRSLEYLLLPDCDRPTDISPLSALPHLKTLGLFDSDFGNPGSLMSFPSLRHLAFSVGDDGSFLGELDRLESLVVSGHNSLDCSFLDRMSSLRRLHLNSINPTLEVLRNLNRLKELTIDKYSHASLEPLIELKELEALGLENSDLTDLSALDQFAKLKHLDIHGSKIDDISCLRGQASIEFLQLSGNPITNFPNQLGMPAIKHLVWRGSSNSEQLSNTDFLSDCPSLEAIDLSSHRLADVKSLAGLGNLRYLDVSDNGLEDVSPLRELPHIASLDVSKNNIRSLAPLTGWTAVKSLLANDNPLEDATVLSRLRSLESLELSNTGLKDLDFTKRLRQLFKLDVSKNQIRSMEPLVELPNIAQIDLRENQIAEVAVELIERRSVESLSISGNPLNISVELYGDASGVQTLTTLRDYYRSLARGVIKNDQAKLVIVGNGRVGKTSVVTRLIDDEFDPDQPSTHGIQLRHWELQGVAQDRLDGQPLKVDVWDFGGQDIYHATHRLFMKTRALFLLVWDRETEDTRYSLDEVGERYENFSIAYWIDYIKALSGSPVVITQNKVDELADKDVAYGGEMQQIYPPPDGVIDYRYVSAMRDTQNGMAGLRESIELALDSFDAIGYALPAQWVEIRDQILDMDRKFLDYDRFQAMCKTVGMQPGEDESLAGFLHQTGVVFYQPEHFGERLIRDQKWAIEAVYALLDRRGGAYSDLKIAARFGLTLDQLKEKVWRHFSVDEHQLLLEFMKSCEICFEFSKGVYFIPQLLPDELPSRVRVRWPDPTEFCMQINYPFLHRAIIDRFLVRSGLLGDDTEPEIWRNGIVIYDAKIHSEAMVEGIPDENRIRVRARGDRPVEMLQMIEREFEELHNDFPAAVAFSADSGDNFVTREMLAQHADAGSVSASTIEGSMTEIAALKVFLNDRRQSLPKGKLKGAGPSVGGTQSGEEIFISYAWGDPSEKDKSREAIVDRLYDTLVNKRKNVIRDKKDAGYKMEISAFMRRIGRGKHVVVVISDKYLRSPYCMFELLEIYEQGGFQERIIPIVLGDAKLYDLSDRLQYMVYWKRKKTEIEELMQEIGPSALSSDGAFKEYDLYYRRVFNNVDKLTSLLGDLNALSPEMLEENDFERVLQTIEQRVADAA